MTILRPERPKAAKDKVTAREDPSRKKRTDTLYSMATSAMTTFMSHPYFKMLSNITIKTADSIAVSPFTNLRGAGLLT